MHTVTQSRYGRGPDPADIRSRVHGMWARVAPAWGKHADYTDARGGVLAGHLFDLVSLAPGERVLELACGPGGLGLAAATHVGPGGEVVASDVVPAMTAIAAERARARGLTNVTARVLDLESIDERDAGYDVVLCREGLMFAVDPGRALSEIRRVLRPGGRMAITVWSARELNPWLGIVLDAVSAQMGRPVPPPGTPGPFSLADAELLARMGTRAGLADVAVSEMTLPTTARSFDEWWARTSALAGPVSHVIASLPEDGRKQLRARVQAAAEPYVGVQGIAFPGATLIATGRAA